MARGFSGVGGRESGVAISIFFLALLLRIANAPLAFDHGRPQIAPVDELYHWKRMTFSAQHFPQVLELDGDRGLGGAFCPWPPLYDLCGGGIARLFGARSADEVLGRVVWIPPLAGALAVALAAVFLTRRFGLLAGSAAAIALATSPFIVTQSSIGDIDHHFLEWPLVLGIMLAAGGWRLATGGWPLAAGGWRLAVAMSAALFVQTALIVACALAFAVVFMTGERRRAAGAFFGSAIAVAVYRLTRAAGYPDSAWFLGWPHAALLAAAGTACIFKRRWVGLIGGAAIALGAFLQVREGVHFFGGDRWLQTILEFQPMWRSRGAQLISQIVGLSAGAILVWILAVQAIRRRDRVRGTVALFAIVFLLMTISNRRFWSISIPLLAIAGAICAASFEKRPLRIIAGAAVAIIPAVQLATWMRHPEPPIERYQIAWIRTAEFLRTQPPGRVLAPWALGHTLDVIGRHAVIIDNFGSMPDRLTFERAHQAMLAPDEATLARYCDASHVRYIALYDPAFGVRTAAAILGVPAPPSTWYQRAYDGSLSSPRFQLIYRTEPAFVRAAVAVWEYRDLAAGGWRLARQPRTARRQPPMSDAGE